ncbi:hypothetical protein KR018_003995, partial [Drosophila ironensis]
NAQNVLRQPYPNDCQRFVESRVLSCPPDFYWNAQLQQCQLNSIDGCISAHPLPDPGLITVPDPVVTSPNLRGLCYKKLGELIAYPGDCQKFIQCDYIPFVKRCPEYLYWNSKLLTCDKICI